VSAADAGVQKAPMAGDLGARPAWNGVGHTASVHDTEAVEAVEAVEEAEESEAEKSRNPVGVEHLRHWIGRRDPVRSVLLAMVLSWSVLFIWLGILRHNRFGTNSFDLGIYDQGVWLLSRLKYPFVTVRGLSFFGHHMNPILVLLVPFYWLGGGPIFLLVVQVAAQASGAVAIYLIARDRLADQWLAVALAGALLLNPTYQYLTWEFFHPDALAIAPLLFAYWAARAKRWRWFALAAVLAVACKEDVGLAMAALGLLVWARGDRRVGMVVAGASMVWYALATRVMMPFLLHGLNPFYDGFFGDFGSTSSEVARNIVTHPVKVIDVATRPDRISYYRMMLVPVGFLALAEPGTLMVAVPMVVVNALTTFPYARDFRYHYSALVLAGVMLATVEGVARLGGRPGFRRFLVGMVVATSLASTVAWGPSPISTKYRSGIWPLIEDSRDVDKRAAVAMIPDGESVSATYYFVPHLTHRVRIYDFPEPWKVVNWGVKGERLHDPGGVDWIVVDRSLFSDYDRKLIDRLLEGEFNVRFERNDFLVLERTSPGGRIAIDP